MNELETYLDRGECIQFVCRLSGSVLGRCSRGTQKRMCAASVAIFVCACSACLASLAAAVAFICVARIQRCRITVMLMFS